MRNLARLCSVFASIMVLSACAGQSQQAGKCAHEQDWIVSETIRDVSEMALYAAVKSGSKNASLADVDCRVKELSGNGGQINYQVVLQCCAGRQEQKLALSNYLWDPDNYAPLALQLFQHFNLKPGAPPQDSSTDGFIQSLSNYNSEVIARENKRLSDALTENPLDPVLHEEAALLCACFGLRESASCFSDVRPWLNRISAHLAFARALRGKQEYSLCGKLAEAAMMCLSTRCRPGMALIAQICQSDAGSSKGDQAGASDAAQSWLRALKVYATHDFRIADLSRASSLERFQYGRALADDIGSDYLTDFLRKQKLSKADAAEWIRIGARGVNTVESGHIYAESCVRAELTDFLEDCRIYKNVIIKSVNEAASELSLPPTRALVYGQPPHLEVISWGDVSAFHARHLLDSVFQKYYFEKTSWGVPEEAKATAKQADIDFANVKLYPLLKVSILWAEGLKTSPDLNEKVAQLMANEPEAVNSTLWHRARFCASKPEQIPQPYSWFKPRFLQGTAFDFAARNFQEDPDIDSLELNELYRLNPYDRALDIAFVYAKYPHESFSGKQLSDAFGVLAEVDIQAMERIAQAYKHDPEKYAGELEKMAALKPDKYFALGDFYGKQGDVEKARKSYECALRLCRDPVLLSNNSAWLVNYYFDHGQKEEALSLAKKAADVYSYTGLETLAKLYERMGDLKQAEAYYARVRDRYNEAGDLARFYLAHKAANPAYAAGYDHLVKAFFPQGLKKIDPKMLDGAPKAGVIISAGSDATNRYGLRYGDIFVSLDGYRVETQAQYMFIRGLDTKPEMEFTVWNGSAYRTLKASLPERKWGCRFDDYKAP